MAELEPHPWNRDFAWAPLRGPFRSISEAEAALHGDPESGEPTRREAVRDLPPLASGG